MVNESCSTSFIASLMLMLSVMGPKGVPTPSECESEKDQRTIGKDQRMSGKTSKNIFAFAFAFAWCGETLRSTREGTF